MATCTVSGTLYNPSGDPVQNARVIWSNEAFEHGTLGLQVPKPVESTTDASGVWSVDIVETASVGLAPYRVTIEHPDFDEGVQYTGIGVPAQSTADFNDLIPGEVPAMTSFTIDAQTFTVNTADWTPTWTEDFDFVEFTIWGASTDAAEVDGVEAQYNARSTAADYLRMVNFVTESGGDLGWFDSAELSTGCISAANSGANARGQLIAKMANPSATGGFKILEFRNFYTRDDAQGPTVCDGYLVRRAGTDPGEAVNSVTWSPSNGDWVAGTFVMAVGYKRSS